MYIYIYIPICIYIYTWEGTLFSQSHIYYAHLASVRFQHSVCRGSLMATYIYIYIYIYICTYKYITYPYICIYRCMNI